MDEHLYLYTYVKSEIKYSVQFNISSKLHGLGVDFKSSQFLRHRLNADHVEDSDEVVQVGLESSHLSPVEHGMEHTVLEVLLALIGRVKVNDLLRRKAEFLHEVTDLVFVEGLPQDGEGSRQKLVCGVEELYLTRPMYLTTKHILL